MPKPSLLHQRLVARCWADDTFKQQLLADPAAALADAGMPLPDGVTLRVVESTPDQFWLVIPPKPTDLSDEQLDAVAGGGSRNCSVDDGLCWHKNCGDYCG